MAALADYLDAEDYSDFRTGQETTLEGERAWWRNIIEADFQRITAEIRLHADAYERLGYKVELLIDQGHKSITLHVKHKSRRVNTADLEILKGAMAATRVKSGWGGSG